MKSTSEQTIRISRIHRPVSVLGFGRRVGIWTQGCSIGCSGCVSVDTWDSLGGAGITVDGLLAKTEELIEGCDGVTISGGEPFDQPEALESLLTGLRGIARRAARPVDILAYSGRNLPYLKRHHQTHLGLLDAVVAGPFVEERPSTHPWFGSDNQKLVPLSPIGQERYGKGDRRGERTMQIQVDPGGSVWMIGVPRRGDMAKIEAGLAKRGITLEDSSWLS